MFSNNGKISGHQAVRLLIMDVFTGACLFLPMALSRVAGNGGLLALILGLILTLMDGCLISGCLEGSGGDYISSLGKGIIGYGLRWMYGARCFAAFIFLFGMFFSVLSETFLYTMPGWLIILGMALVLIYGSTKGIEVRARLSEILFYLVLVPIILIGIFSLPEADWSQVMELSDITFSGIFQGMLVTWVLMAPVEWILFISPEIEKGKIRKILTASIMIGGGLILFIYILCVTVLTTKGMAAERWPTVILMQIVRIPGGFLSRQDGLMLSFWIFAMFISLSGALSHAAGLLGTRQVQIKKWKVWLLTGIGAAAAFYFGMERRGMDVYFRIMLVSGLILLWLVPFIYCLFRGKKRKMKRNLMMFLLLFGVGSITGCDTYTELENKAFVMALGVDIGEDGAYRLTYTFPDLEALTGTGIGEKEPPLTLEAKNLKDGEIMFGKMSDKVLDYGQVKVLVLGKTLISDRQALDRLLAEIGNKPEFARTVMVCGSFETAEQLLALDESVYGSIGIYMEEMFENNKCEKILNDCMVEMNPDSIPVIGIRDGKPVILPGAGSD